MKTTAGEQPELTPMQRRIAAIVLAGTTVIAAIGFAGSYAAVRRLAEAKGFGRFALLFPIGIDAGIVVLLALDLLLTWFRMPLALLRYVAWLLTAATIVFNAAVSWPDPIGTGMHAVIPILFVAAVEAGRHAIGRRADITADKHMEGVRLTRWLLSPVSTFLLWRRMRLWELRSYEQTVRLEQERLIERTRLRRRYGRRWRSKAPVEAVLALRLTRYGQPLASVSGALSFERGPELEAAVADVLRVTGPVDEDIVSEQPDTEPDTTPDTSGQPDSETGTPSGHDGAVPHADAMTSPDTRPDSPDPLAVLAEAASGPSDLVRSLAAHGVPKDDLVSEAVRLRPDIKPDSIRRTFARLGEGPYL